MNEWPWPSNAEAIRAFRDSAIPPFPPGFLPAPGKPDAAATADALLQERLGARAYALFQETGRLMRPSRLWRGVEYRLQRNEPVRVIQGGQPVASLCVVARHGEPEADRLLTILDLIETDERRLWEMGNLGEVSAPPPGMPDMPPRTIMPLRTNPDWTFRILIGFAFVWLLGGVILAVVKGWSW